MIRFSVLFVCFIHFMICVIIFTKFAFVYLIYTAASLMLVREIGVLLPNICSLSIVGIKCTFACMLYAFMTFN